MNSYYFWWYRSVNVINTAYDDTPSNSFMRHGREFGENNSYSFWASRGLGLCNSKNKDYLTSSSRHGAWWLRSSSKLDDKNYAAETKENSYVIGWDLYPDGATPDRVIRIDVGLAHSKIKYRSTGEFAYDWLRSPTKIQEFSPNNPSQCFCATNQQGNSRTIPAVQFQGIPSGTWIGLKIKYFIHDIISNSYDIWWYRSPCKKVSGRGHGGEHINYSFLIFEDNSYNSGAYPPIREQYANNQHFGLIYSKIKYNLRSPNNIEKHGWWYRSVNAINNAYNDTPSNSFMRHGIEFGENNSYSLFASREDGLINIII